MVIGKNEEAGEPCRGGGRTHYTCAAVAPRAVLLVYTG